MSQRTLRNWLASLVLGCLFTPHAAIAACNPSNAPLGSIGCYPDRVATYGQVLASDMMPIWVPGSFPNSQLSITMNELANFLSAGAGYVSGPGSSTTNYIPTWNGGSGTLLNFGVPYGLMGNNTIVETNPNGFINAGILPFPDTTFTTSSTALSGTQNNFNGANLTATSFANPAVNAQQTITNQNATALTINNNGVAIAGLPVSTTLHSYGFYEFAYNAITAQWDAYGFPGFGTITSNAVPTFMDGTGALTASSITDNGTGVLIGSPAGGAKGAGSLNAQALYGGSAGVGTGSAFSPSYSFIGDPNTGLYLATTGELGIAVAGASVADYGQTIAHAWTFNPGTGGFNVNGTVNLSYGPAAPIVNVGFGAAQGLLVALNNHGGFVRDVGFQTQGLTRWIVETDAATETGGGSNSGSNFNIQRWSDGGALIDSVMTILRSSGLVTFADGVSIGGALTLASVPKFASSSTGAATQTFTNTPCATHTTEQWIPITITGQSGTWFVPACQ